MQFVVTEEYRKKSVLPTPAVQKKVGKWIPYTQNI